MKKIIALICVFLLAVCPIASAQNSGTDSKLEQAEQLLSAVLGEPVFAEEGTVTRGEFVSVAGRLFKHNEIYIGQDSFLDVSASSEGANEIYTALKLGYISKTSHFYPENPITYGAAVKLAVCYLGYQVPAESKGGYPTGYQILASSVNLLKNIGNYSTDDEISARDASILLYNLMLADEIAPTYVGEKFYYYKTGESVLSSLHDIYEAEGVVSSTFYGNIVGTEHNSGKKSIEIEGVAYDADSCDESLLGKNVKAFYKSDDKETRKIIAVFPVDNTEYGFKLTDISSVSKSEIKYIDEASGDEEEISLDSGEVVLIYNGRYAKFDKEYFENREGVVRTIDHDGDGDAEIVAIDSYSYITVENVSPVGEFIGATKATESLNLKGADIDWRLTDYEGNEISLYDLKQGELVAVKKSVDGKLISLIRCDKVLGGQVDEINTGYNEITVDGTVYKMSRNLIVNHLSGIKAGSIGKFTMGLYGTLAAYNEDAGIMRYAYLLGAQKAENSFGAGKLKVLMKNGEIKIIDVKDKIMVDGDSSKVSHDALMKGFEAKTYPCPSLIKISVSSENELKKIDFPSIYDESMGDPNSLSPDDNLLKYDFGVTGFSYRSTPQSMQSYFNVKDSTIFKIPKDISLEETMQVGTSSILTNGRSYTMTPYDIDESGTAKAVVWTVNNVNPTLDRYDNSYIVENITDGIDSNGAPVKYVHCWSLGDFKTLYLEDDVEIIKSSGESLCGGDIIRVNVDGNNKIRAIAVDFEMAGSIPQANEAIKNTNSYISSMYGGGDISFTYQFGKLYRANGGYLTVSNVTDVFGDYDFSLKNLRNLHASTNNIIKYDSKTGKLRPVALEELKSYISYNDEAHYIVLRQSNLSVNSIYVYE